MVEELEGGLARYQGAVVVTDDRRMRTRFTGRHVQLNAGHVAQFQEAGAV